MKKNLLTIALMVSLFQSKAQILTTVAEGGLMTVKQGTLVYNGGGMRIVGSGKVDNYGNVMIVGNGNASTPDLFQTVTTAAGTTPKLNGGNFNLKYVDTTIGSAYGQLYITNLRQADITGVVDKEYRATKNGTFQQMAIPFHNKKLSGTYTDVVSATSPLSFDLGTGGFSNLRNTNSVGYWENQRVLMHNLPNTAATSNMAANDVQSTVNNNAARYYAVGTAAWDPAVLHTIKGVPFSDISSSAASTVMNSATSPLTYALSGAGYNGATPIPYGVGTGNLNNGVYNEQYKTYLQDAFAIANNQGFFNGTAGNESGNFGRNLYQFSNPFLTNLDISHINWDEDGAGNQDDLNTLNNIYGIRYESLGVVTSNLGATSSTSYKYITYTPSGIGVGDTSGAIIKPMQAFVIKLKSNSVANQNLVFNNLRRFAYTSRSASTPATVSSKNNNNVNTIKQLRVIGLDANGDEVMRTYYVVGASLVTGRLNDVNVQASAFSGTLSTREELPGGGEDAFANTQYWLYINEANEVDFLGKKISMVANLNSIASFKFELAENAVELTDGVYAFADGGKSFYIEQTPGTYTQIAHNQVVPATAANSGLYYGQPNSGTLSTSEVKKDDELIVAFEDKTKTHQVIFPRSWSKATVNVFDMAGRKIFSQKDIATRENFVLNLDFNAAYLVEAISEKGVKAVKKIIK